MVFNLGPESELAEFYRLQFILWPKLRLRSTPTPVSTYDSVTLIVNRGVLTFPLEMISRVECNFIREIARIITQSAL